MAKSVCDISLRPPLVTAAVPRSAVLAVEESSWSRHAVVAAMVGFQPDWQLSGVARAFAARFGVELAEIKVSVFAPHEFLVFFNDNRKRDEAVRIQGALTLGSVSFHISPWSRFRLASPVQMRFKVRVCLEKVPKHAWSWDCVRGLFDHAVIFDSVDSTTFSEEETACFNIWVWMETVEKLATKGVLQLEEPREVASPGRHFPELGIFEEEQPRWGPVSLLEHKVLIHLDRIWDYTLKPGSSSESYMRDHSDTSGMPSDVMMSEEYPEKWHYRWNLDWEDGNFPPPPPRPSVHGRLRYPEGRRDEDGDEGRRGRGQGRRSRWDVDNCDIFGQQRGQSSQDGAGGRFSGGRRHGAAEPEDAAGGVRASEEAPGGWDPMVGLLADPSPVRAPPRLTTGYMFDRRLTEEEIEKEQGGINATSPAGSVFSDKADRLGVQGSTTSLVGDRDGFSDGSPAEQPMLGTGPGPVGFGPHSPKSMLGDADRGRGILDALGSISLGTTSAQEDGHLEGTATMRTGLGDALASFLVDCSAPLPIPLLPTPEVVLGATAAPVAGGIVGLEARSKMVVRDDDAGISIRSSGRLKAKPTSGLSALDKARCVLLKKEGVVLPEGTPDEVLIKRYKDLYKKPLPSSFIEAVTALVEVGKQPKKAVVVA